MDNLPIAPMNSTHSRKLVAVLAGAVVAAAGAALLLPAAPSKAESAVPTRQTGVQGGGQQDPETFRLTEREATSQEGQRVRVGDSQLIFDSIFEFTDRVNDLFVWAWMPTISGEIADNAFLGGQKVELTEGARIGGDLFIFAQSAGLDGTIGGDIYAFVAEMSIGASGRVEGSIYGSSGTLVIEGEVAGPVRYAGGVVTINGIVRGDVRVEAGELELGPEAVIEGELRYESPREATIDPGARVEGGIRYFAPRDDDEDEAAPAPPPAISVWGVLWDAWWLLSSFLVGAIALALGGEAARRPAQRLLQQPALGLGFGFVIAVVVPAAAILAMVLLVTIPLGLITVAVYLAAAYLARLVAAQAVGDAVLALLRGGRRASPYATLALGLVLFYLLTQIPYFGFLIWLAAVVGGLGGIFLASRKAAFEGEEAAAVAPTAR